MPNILLTLAFRGSRYHGFQVQQNALSVCEVLQDAMQKVFGLRPDVKGCSRTDSGVHANAYCVSFRLEKPFSLYHLPLALNAALPPDIRAVGAQEVPEDFHARYSAAAKQYVYKLRSGPVASPFEEGLVWRVGGPPLDVPAMQAAAAACVGKHDFASFMSAGSKITDTVRTVHWFRVQPLPPAQPQPTHAGVRIDCTICADGYLYNMVRILVGTLTEIGAHRMQAEDMPSVLKACSRSAAGPLAPAEGLYLDRVFYAWPPQD